MKADKKTAVKIIILLFVLFLCIHYWQTVEWILYALIGALAPIFTGFAIAYVINIIMSFFEKHYFPKAADTSFIAKTRRPVCLLLSLFILCILVTFIILMVVPELIACISVLIAEIPKAVEVLVNNDHIKDIIPENAMSILTNIDWDKHIGNIVNILTSGIGNAATAIFTAITSIFNLVASLLLSFIFAIYILFSKEKLSGQLDRVAKSYVKEKHRTKIYHIASIANDSFRRYIVGQCTEALLLGVLCTIGMKLLNIPYAIMIGTLIGLTALVPIAGAYIGAAIGVVMILTESPMKALIFLIFLVCLQQFEGNVIYPKVVGKKIGLPSAYVLLAITVGGGIGGIFGMMIGVPIVSVIYRLVREDVYNKEREKANEFTAKPKPPSQSGKQ